MTHQSPAHASQQTVRTSPPAAGGRCGGEACEPQGGVGLEQDQSSDLHCTGVAERSHNPPEGVPREASIDWLAMRALALRLLRSSQGSHPAIQGTQTGIMWGLSPAPLARPDPLGREAPLLSAAGGRHLASLDPVLDRPRERALKAFTGRPLPGVSGTVSPRCQAWLRLQVACFVASAKEGRGPLIGPQGRARRDVDMPGLARICLKHKQQTTRVFAPLCATHGIGYLCTGTHTVVRLPRALLLRPSGR